MRGRAGRQTRVTPSENFGVNTQVQGGSFHLTARSVGICSLRGISYHSSLPLSTRRSSVPSADPWLFRSTSCGEVNMCFVARGRAEKNNEITCNPMLARERISKEKWPFANYKNIKVTCMYMFFPMFIKRLHGNALIHSVLLKSLKKKHTLAALLAQLLKHPA